MDKERFWDIFFPPHCIFCRKVLDSQYLSICDACAKEMAQPPQPRKGEFFTTCISALPYDDMTRKSILRMKMGSKRSYTKTYGRMIAAQVKQKLDGKFDAISWVPISSLRRARRGFDQDRLIAEAAAEALQMPLLETLKKKKHNRPQASISDAAHRRANVLNVYKPLHPEAFSGKRILLIDDVITTGSTLSECCRVLRTAGAAAVVCATFAATNKSR